MELTTYRAFADEIKLSSEFNVFGIDNAVARSAGEEIGGAVAAHAPAAGESIGRGIAKELVEKVKGLGKSNKVRAGAAALGTAYLARKAHNEYKEHKRGKNLERLASAVEALGKKDRSNA